MLQISTSTNDFMIRSAIVDILKQQHKKDREVRIVEELGVHHGNARVDIAVVNGIMHGYEIKSDQDTLRRLPEQIEFYNSVFDKMTLVVGKNHLHSAMKLVPDWWGIMIAKVAVDGKVVFNRIRNEEQNKEQDLISVARLLWREEALNILKEMAEDCGLQSKSRDFLYNKLATTLDKKTLGQKVRETIFFRADWRPGSPLVSNDG